MCARSGSAVMALAVLLLALPAPSAPAAKRCKAGQVVVKVGKQRSCRPLARAFPKPAAGDPRLEFARTALDRILTVRGLPRSPRSLKAATRRAAGAGAARIRRALPRVLKLIDARAAAAEVMGVAAACNAPQGPQSTSTIGGSSVSISADGAEMSFEGGGVRVLVSMALGGPCDRFDGPRCPTAEGVLEGTDSARFVVTMTVLQGNQLVSRTQSSRTSRQKLQGQSADDAKFDTLAFSDRVQETLQAGPVNISAVVTRDARYDMRAMRWEPGGARASVNYLMAGGQFVQGAEVASLQNRLASDYDRDFAQVAGRALEVYRGREANMLKPGECATLKLDPASGTLQPLALRASGALTATAEAKEGGGSSAGRFTVSDQQNGTFLPPQARGNPGTFRWLVTKAGRDVRLSARVKATSKAGTTQTETWSQPTKPTEPPVTRIAGTVSGATTVQTQLGPSVISHSGGVTYERSPPAGSEGAVGSYALKAGDTITFQASGIDGSFSTGCKQQGTKTFPLVTGSMNVFGAGLTLAPPYSYGFQASPPSGAMMTITRVQCPQGAQSMEGTTFELPVGGFATSSQHSTDDELAYRGSEEDGSGGSGVSLSWSLTGTRCQDPDCQIGSRLPG